MSQSDVQRLIAAVQQLGEACGALSNKTTGAEQVLRAAQQKLSQSRDTSDIGGSLSAAGVRWQAIENATKAAAIDAHRFATTQL